MVHFRITHVWIATKILGIMIISGRLVNSSYWQIANLHYRNGTRGMCQLSHHRFNDGTVIHLQLQNFLLLIPLQNPIPAGTALDALNNLFPLQNIVLA